jgi:hypothetical protein
MRDIELFINRVLNTSKKRTGLIYCSDSFEHLIKQFELIIPNITLFDCTQLYNGKLIYSASELLFQIEEIVKKQTCLIMNLETFITPNTKDFPEQFAKLLVAREPQKPMFFLFYSKTIFSKLKFLYDSKELNKDNTIEL